MKKITKGILILVGLMIICFLALIIFKLWNKIEWRDLMIVGLSIVFIGLFIAIFVLLLLSLDFNEMRTKKIELTLVGLLVKLLSSILLIAGMLIFIEMLYEHFIHQDHQSFFQRIALFFDDNHTNYSNDNLNNLSDHIGYLQVLIAIVTIAVGGIALINFVTSKETLKEIREENITGLANVKSDMQIEMQKLHDKFDEALSKKESSKTENNSDVEIEKDKEIKDD